MAIYQQQPQTSAWAPASRRALCWVVGLKHVLEPVASLTIDFLCKTDVPTRTEPGAQKHSLTEAGKGVEWVSGCYPWVFRTPRGLMAGLL